MQIAVRMPQNDHKQAESPFPLCVCVYTYTYIGSQLAHVLYGGHVPYLLEL